MSETFDGPIALTCPNRCEFPEGRYRIMPRPRHAWGDVLRCPHTDDGCELAFMVVARLNPSPRLKPGV